MGMEREVIILNARNVNFKNEATGELVEGVSINYVDDLDPYVLGDSKGTDVFKSFMDKSVFKKLTTVPGKYLATIKRSSNSKGQSIEKLADLEFIEVL